MPEGVCATKGAKYGNLFLFVAYEIIFTIIISIQASLAQKTELERETWKWPHSTVEAYYKFRLLASILNARRVDWQWNREREINIGFTFSRRWMEVKHSKHFSKSLALNRFCAHGRAMNTPERALAIFFLWRFSSELTHILIDYEW